MNSKILDKETLMSEKAMREYKNLAQQQLLTSHAIEKMYEVLKDTNKEPDVINVSYGNTTYQKQQNGNVSVNARNAMGGDLVSIINSYIDGLTINISIKYQIKDKNIGSVEYSYNHQVQEITFIDCMGEQELESVRKQ